MLDAIASSQGDSITPSEMTSATVVRPSLLEILDEDDAHVIAPLASELVLEDASPESFNIIENNDSVVTAESTSVAVPHFTGGATSPATAGLMGVIRPTRPKSKYVWKCSESQEAFIARTRSKIDAGVCNELFVDWMNIRPCKIVYGPNAEKVGASDYYIKPIAAWLPHLLFPGHIPYCPKCEKNDRVEVCHASWIDHPMVLYCLMGVKHLDTMRVPCTRCNPRFRLTNAKSLSLDTTGRIMGVFRVHLGKRTAVDESLYHYITNRMNDPAAAIARQLKHLTLQKYVADIIEFMLKVKMKMARIESKEGSLLVRHLSRASSATSLTAIGKERQVFEERLRDAKYKLKRVVSRKLKSVNFSAMLERKGKKRASSACGLGEGKLKKLTNCGIMYGHELVELYDEYLSDTIDPPPKIKDLFNELSSRKPEDVVGGWVGIIRTELKSYSDAVVSVEEEVKYFTAELERLIEFELPTGTGIVVVNEDNTTLDEQVETGEEELPKFSSVWDAKGYGARVIGRHLVSDIQHTHFLLRKPLMLRSITALGGQVLSFDVEYKMAKRIYVFKGKTRFRPYKAFAAIRNEYRETIWWKMLRRDESMNLIFADLKRFRDRLNSLQDPNHLKVVYIDTCCKHRANVAMVNVGRRESVQGRAPYSIRLQQNDVQIALPKPSFRAICKCCGRKKTMHSGLRSSDFGDKCNWTSCGRCGLADTVHKSNNVEMGYHCTLGTANGVEMGEILKYNEMLRSMTKTREI
eukprot:scaffold173661_cov32-Attheya_sp.AAC.1